MLKGYKILTSFCVICATLYGGAYGAASVRGGATSRAGSIRTLGAGTAASVKTTTARPQSNTVATVDTGNTETVGGGRMPVASGLSGSKLPGKVSGTTSSSGDSQNVAELRQAIEQLRSDYDALGEQYNNLSSDISNVSDTAQVAHDVAANNTNTLTLVRTDLSVAQSDIEELKANGGLDEEAVQEALNTTLAQKNYATRGELAVTDAVARGAVQVADLPQRLNALNIADKDYVANQAQGAVNDSLNITLGNYYTKGQVNDAIGQAKLGMVDKDYVDDQVRGLAPKNYVDARVAAIEVGVNEDAVQGIVNNSIGTRLANYYTKGDIDDALVDAVADAKAGMADRDYVNNQVRDVTSYVDERVAEVEGGVDAGTLYNILGNYKTDAEVRGIVNDSINNTMGNYYNKGQVDSAINAAKNGMADRNYVDNQIDGLAPKNWVNTVVDTKVNALPLGLNRDAVKGVVEEYGYKTENDVRGIVTSYGYATVADLPDMINQWAPGAELQYADGKLYFVDKDGNDRVVDIRGLDGQDGAQIELRKSDGQIQWRWTSGDDQSWHDLVALSELAGADGKSVELDVVNNNLVWKKDGESGWQYLYDLGSITGVDGCGVKANTTNTANGTKVRLLKDCAGQTGDGQLLTEFEVINGADGTVSEEQIIDALESNSTFVQLKNKVNKLETDQVDTHNLAADVYDAVNNGTTGLAATNTLANKAWSKVEDLEATNKTARVYVDNAIGDLGYSSLYPLTKFASVAAKLGDIGPMQTVAEYINDQVSKVNTSIEVRRDYNGYAYICNTGKCTGDPYPNSPDWTRISVDLTEYLTKDDANELYAKSSLVNAVDNAQQTAELAIEKANQSLGKLDGINTTVKGYVDDYVKSQVGTLGFNIYTGLPYTVEGKLGFTNTAGTVKEYIDSAVRSANTKIKVERSVIDGKTYICKNGDACTSQPGPYSTDEWVPVSVDMSGYLTEDDADNRYATISALDNVKTTVNEAKTTAAAAQQTANTAQSTATAAQSTADAAWGKLSDLGNTTVREFVEDKVSGLGTTIDVKTVGGVTYICKIGKCLDTPPSSYWEPITVTISDEYLTEIEGNALYAPKAEYALKSDIGSMGNFGSVEERLGAVPTNQTMVQYIAAQLSNVSTNIQIETSNGTTYICKQGSGCPTYDLTNTSYWAPVAVNLGDLGTNPTTQRTYTVAEKIGLTGTNSNKNVVGYIGDRIGETGNSITYPYAQRSVVEYIQDTYVPLTRLGNEIGSNQTVTNYISQRIGNTGTVNDSYSGQSRPKTVVEFLAGSYVPLTTIGNLGYPQYSTTPYTVEGKIGLNSTTDSSKTVKQYVDGLIGTSSLGTYDNVIAYGNANYAPKSAFDTLSSTVSGHTTLLGGLNGVTVKDYVDSKTPNIQIAPGSNGKMYYCTLATRCNTDYLDTAHGWQEFDISESLNLSTYLKTADAANTYLTIADAANTYAPKSVQSAVEDPTNGLSATHTLASGASTAASNAQQTANAAQSAAEGAQSTANTANTTANNAWDKVKGLNDVSGLTDKTVTGYVAYRLGDITSGQTVKQYVDDKVATVKPTIMTETYQGTTYICSSGNCTNHAPNDGWEELSVDLSALDNIEAILGGFGTGDNDWPSVMSYIGNMGTYLNSQNVEKSYTVASKIGLNSGDDASKTVKQYVDNAVNGLATETYVGNKIGNLGNNAANTPAVSVAAKLGSDITSADKTVAQYIADYVAANTSSGGVTVKTVSNNGVNETYICSGDHCDGEPPCANGTYPDTCGWQKLDIDLGAYLKSDTAARTYLPQSGLKLVRDGADIKLQQVDNGTVVHDYGIIAGVQDLMCRSYRTESVQPGYDGCPVNGSVCYRLVCNTNDNE